MPEEITWNWVEWLFNRIPLPYSIVSILIGLAVLFTFVLFDLRLKNSIISRQYLTMVVEAIAIAYLLISNKFLLKAMNSIFDDLCYLYIQDDKTISTNLEIRFKSYWYYIFIAVIIISFSLINWVNPLDYIRAGMIFAFVIYNLIIGIILLFLLGNIAWIAINITWGLYEVANSVKSCNMSRSIFTIDCKIKSIRGYLNEVTIYYFIGIALLILIYINPVSFGTYEIALLIALFFIGVIPFFFGLSAIQSILSDRLECELDSFNGKLEGHLQEIVSLMSEGNYTKVDQIEFISSGLEALRNHRDELVKINARIYDLSTVATFVTSILIAAISLLGKIGPELISSLISTAIFNNIFNAFNNYTIQQKSTMLLSNMLYNLIDPYAMIVFLR